MDNLVAGVINGQYISSRCAKCLANATSSGVYANKWRRDRDREDHRRDILQVDDEGFAKEYPDAARQKGYTEEDMRRLG